MTKWQALALVFPVITAAGVALTAYGVKLWLDRKYPESLTTTDTTDHAAAALVAIDEAQRALNVAVSELSAMSDERR